MATTTTTLYTCDGCGATEEYPQSWLAVQRVTKSKPATPSLAGSYLTNILTGSPGPPPLPSPPPAKHYCSPKCLRAAYKIPKATA